MKVGEFFDGGGQLIEGLLMGAQAFFDQVSAWFGSIGDMILGAIGDLGSLLYDTGANLVNGFINGVQSMANSLIESVKGPIDDAVQGAKNLLGIASPSKVFRQIGRYTSEGLALGILDDRQKVDSAIAQVAGGVVSGYSARLGTGLGTVKAASASSAGGGTVIHVHGDVGVKADNADEFMQSFIAAIGDMARLGDA